MWGSSDTICRHGAGRRARGAWLASTALLGMAMSLSPAVAQQAGPRMAQNAANAQSIAFVIPAQSLASAIVSFSRIAGVDVVFDGSIARGLRTPGVVGTFTPPEGLRRLLAGTGISAQITGPRNIKLVGGNAGGATSGLDPEGSIALDAIDVSSGTPPGDIPFETPGSTSYISSEDIERFRGTSTGDMFKGTPGVISGMNRNGAALDINIRGLQGMNRVRVTVDGTQQTTSTWRGYSGADDRVYVDPDLVGGIGIEKGPTSGADGAGQIGGVVAIRTLNADDLIEDGKDYGVRLRAGTSDNAIAPPAPWTYNERNDAPSFYDFDNGFGSVAAAARKDNFEIVAAFARRKTGNYFAGTNGPTDYTVYPTGSPPRQVPLSFTKPGEEVFNTSQDVTSGLVKGTLRWLDGQSLELGYMRYENDYGEIMPTVIRNQEQSQRQVNLSRTEVDTYTARYRWDPADNDTIDLRANLWATHVDATTRSVSPAPPFNFGPCCIYIPADDPRSSQTTTWGGELFNTSLFETQYGPVSLNYGASYALEDTEGLPYYSRLYTRETPLILRPTVGTREIWSVFSQGEWIATDWLKFNAGLRYDGYATQDKQDPSYINPNQPIREYADQSGGRLNPTFSVTLTPWSGIQLYGLYAEGMRAPSLRETTASDVALYPNPYLQPEIAKNLEFGVNVLKDGVLTGNDKLRLKAAYFYNNYDQYISRVISPPEIRQYAFYTTENLDKAVFSGFELSGSYDVRWMFMDMALTYYDKIQFCQQGYSCASQTISNDYALNYVPPQFTTSLTLGLRLLDEALSVGTRINYAGNRYGGPPGGSEYTRLGMWVPYTVVDAFAKYEFTDNVALDIGVENVFDRYYIDAMNNSAMPSPGRTVRASLTGKF